MGSGESLVRRAMASKYADPVTETVFLTRGTLSKPSEYELMSMFERNCNFLWLYPGNRLP